LKVICRSLSKFKQAIFFAFLNDSEFTAIKDRGKR